jgi:2-polyprenyl-6-methoxyphenol hydroxylase-like FAD-dependent oxidoreductase
MVIPRTDGPHTTADLSCDCCIAGGGPAGIMLGVLLARAGVKVIVLEKHADFLRDFRGDTIHPSTLQIMHEMGVLDEFLERPHTEVTRLRGMVGGEPVTIADFSHLPVVCKFIALMPQWDFLDFLAGVGSRYPMFDLRREHEVRSFLTDPGTDRVSGVVARTEAGDVTVRAKLVVGADGRTSVLRAQSGLAVRDIGAPIDVLWMKLPKLPSDPPDFLGYIDRGRVVVLLDRGDYWQCAYVIGKGTLDALKTRGIDAFHEDVRAIAPFLGDRARTLAWDDIKLLTVTVDRLSTWYRDGLLFIGDAAHAMSPIGGVGINLAIQDAVAAANILAQPLLTGTVRTVDLKKVQKRREMPTVLTQWLQVLVQNNIISAALQHGDSQPMKPPLGIRMLATLPFLQRIPARAVGIGFRPEHLRNQTPFARQR